MDRVDGRVPLDNPPYVFGGWLLEATPAERAELERASVKILADLHAIEAPADAFPALRPPAGTGALRWHVDQQHAYYRWALVDDGLRIPIIGLVDTNCDPTPVDFVIPGNDDALRAIRLFTSKISDAVLAGRQSYEQTQLAEQKTAEGAGAEEGVEYVDTSAYEQYEKQEGEFVEGEPTEVVPTEEAAAAPAGDDESVPQ